MCKWRAILTWAQPRQQRISQFRWIKQSETSRPSKFRIEPLEPRFLLSADFIPVDTGVVLPGGEPEAAPLVRTVTDFQALAAESVGDQDLPANGDDLLRAANTQQAFALEATTPLARNDHYSTKEDTPLTVENHDGVLRNDRAPDDNTLSALLVSGPTHGTLTLNANGSFSYTPTANFNGSDTFTYKANDGTADSNVATVNLTIRAKNDAPVGNSETYSTNEDTALTIAAAQGTLSNDTDAEGDSLRARLVNGPAHGEVRLRADGSFIYTPDDNFNGSDTFSYVARDGDIRSNPTTVNITVNAVNDAPVAANDSYTVNQNTPLVIAAGQGTLANDTDVEGSTLTAALVQGPAHGTLTLNANGSFTYTPTASFLGADSFTYKANDGTVDSGLATVSIVVSPDTSTASVSSITDPGDATKTALRVFGSNSDDVIRLVPVDDTSGGVEVFVNDVSKGTFNPTGRVIVFGLDGNDRIRVSKRIDLKVELYGGAGDDRLRGGGGLNILVGGNGDDYLIGRKEEDLMIGGSGADRLIGTRRGDIMIGNSTIYDQDSTALNKIMDEWSQNNLSQTARIDHLSNGGGLNGSVTLTQTTVLDDQTDDRLRRRTGIDWLFLDQDAS